MTSEALSIVNVEEKILLYDHTYQLMQYTQRLADQVDKLTGA